MEEREEEGSDLFNVLFPFLQFQKQRLRHMNAEWKEKETENARARGVSLNGRARLGGRRTYLGLNRNSRSPLFVEKRRAAKMGVKSVVRRRIYLFSRGEEEAFSLLLFCSFPHDAAAAASWRGR